MILISINGNCLRISQNNTMEEDIICKDKMIITSSPVYECLSFRENVKTQMPDAKDIKQEVVNKVMEILENMHNEAEKGRL